ncbi:hypothetical protein M3Y98_01073400 [Aphelenchoides besseyi]|nr:hypothetical protein M3Y98_01073400 [Aphelenchoides besseyi]
MPTSNRGSSVTRKKFNGDGPDHIGTYSFKNGSNSPRQKRQAGGIGVMVFGAISSTGNLFVKEVKGRTVLAPMARTFVLVPPERLRDNVSELMARKMSDNFLSNAMLMLEKIYTDKKLSTSQRNLLMNQALVGYLKQWKAVESKPVAVTVTDQPNNPSPEMTAAITTKEELPSNITESGDGETVAEITDEPPKKKVKITTPKNSTRSAKKKLTAKPKTAKVTSETNSPFGTTVTSETTSPTTGSPPTNKPTGAANKPPVTAKSQKSTIGQKNNQPKNSGDIEKRKADFERMWLQMNENPLEYGIDSRNRVYNTISKRPIQGSNAKDALAFLMNTGTFNKAPAGTRTMKNQLIAMKEFNDYFPKPPISNTKSSRNMSGNGRPQTKKIRKRNLAAEINLAPKSTIINMKGRGLLRRKVLKPKQSSRTFKSKALLSFRPKVWLY